MTNKPMLSVEREHRLKINRKPFLDLESGAKTGEIRDCSDRDFQVGDSVLLMLVDETGNPTPNELRRKITHIQTGYGLPDGLCVLSYEPAAQPQGEPVAWMFKYLSHSDSPPYSSFEVTDFHQNPKAPGIAQHAPLYAEQPAPVAVVMPELRDFEAWRDRRNMEIAENQGPTGYYVNQSHFATWEAALAEVARLNWVKL